MKLLLSFVIIMVSSFSLNAEITAFDEQALFAHNTFRKIHDAPAITLDSEMSQSAAEYAQKIADMGELKASPIEERRGLGENLAYTCSSDTNKHTGYAPVFEWYAEVCQPGYTLDGNSFSSDMFNHFTQVVWRASLKLGIGMAKGKKDGKDCIFTVARYSPAADLNADYTGNIKKGTFTRDICKHDTLDLIKDNVANNFFDYLSKAFEATVESPVESPVEIIKALMKPSTKSFEEQALLAHNKLRKVHNAPAMTLDSKMSQSAAAYAQKLADMGTLQNANADDRNNEGENLSSQCSDDNPMGSVFNWYKEVCDPGYTFGSEGMGGAGHFTQMVWKTSIKLGIGMAKVKKNGMDCVYIVARYSGVHGNDNGKFKDNVYRGKFKEKMCDDLLEFSMKRGKSPTFTGSILRSGISLANEIPDAESPTISQEMVLPGPAYIISNSSYPDAKKSKLLKHPHRYSRSHKAVKKINQLAK